MEENIERTHGAYHLRIAYTKQEGLDYGGYDPFCFVAQDVLDAIKLEFPSTKNVGNLEEVLAKLNNRHKCLIDIETPNGDVPMWCITNAGFDVIHKDIYHVHDNYTWITYLPDKDERFHVRPDIAYLADWRKYPFSSHRHRNALFEIRVIEEHGKRSFVLKDLLDAIDSPMDEGCVLSCLEGTYKVFLAVPSPLDESLWCVTHDGVQAVIDIIGVKFEDCYMHPVKASEHVIHHIAIGKSQQLDYLQIMTYRHQMGMYPTKEKGPLAEKRIELDLISSLEKQGIRVQSQVRCEVGIADVVTPDTIYEIKDVLTQSKLQKAISQVIAYRVCINPRAKMVVVGKRHDKPISTKFAKKLGVEIIYWEDSLVVDSELVQPKQITG